MAPEFIQLATSIHARLPEGHNLRKHKVSFAHAEQVLRDPMAVTIKDPDSEGELRLVTLGMDSLGRVLVIAHTPRGDRVRLISARKASRSETEHYHA
jgi:uncharacterized DUF497 family protein